jgi:virginiamycin B lyase
MAGRKAVLMAMIVAAAAARHFRAAIAILIAAAVAAALAPQASAAPAVDGEFPIAGGVGTDNDIVEGPDGNMWVTLQNVNGVARITPAGVVTEFPLDNTSFGIAVGPDDNLWVSTTIGVIKVPPDDPDNPTAYDVGLTGGRGIVAGPDDRMWVAGTDQLVSFDVADPEGTDDSTAIAGMAPHGMSVGTDGLLWIADGNGRVISAAAAAGPTVTPYDIQINAAGGAQDVAGGPNGQVAYAAPTTDPQTVGRITPGGSPQMTELVASDPFGVTFAPDGAYWFARSQTNDLLRLTPSGQMTTLTGFAPSGGVGPRKIATGPDNTLWVTLDTPEKVARVTGVKPAAKNPKTAIDRTPNRKLEAKGRKGRATAKFRFSSSSPGAGFQCSLRPKARKPRFKECESPATYKLRPGKYEYAVRAVLDGKRDRTPATFTFKVVRKKR